MRKPKYRDVRESILSASFSYLAQNGLENISMRELCKGTGLSIGSVYYWFDNKEKLIADTAEFGLKLVSDDIFSSAFENICDVESSFDSCFEKIDNHKVELRFIYQLASSPVNGKLIQKVCSDLEFIYNEYAQLLSQKLGYPFDTMLSLVYLFVAAVLDYAVWEDYEKTKIQLDYIYKQFYKCTALKSQ